MTARRRAWTYENKKPQITQMAQIFFLRVPSCNFVANFLVIFTASTGILLFPPGSFVGLIGYIGKMVPGELFLLKKITYLTPMPMIFILALRESIFKRAGFCPLGRSAPYDCIYSKLSLYFFTITS